jgi:glycosyltransferase involved in cell wall biosynthesis
MARELPQSFAGNKPLMNTSNITAASFEVSERGTFPSTATTANSGTNGDNVKPNEPAVALKVALAHHWLVSMRGGEKVLEQFCMLFPDAPVYTLVASPTKLSERIRRHRIITSPLQKIPCAASIYKKMLPLFPAAIRALRVPKETRFVLSSDASMIKGLRLPPGVPHVCYCHSPPRYLWDLNETYRKHTAELGWAGRVVFDVTTPYLRRFDLHAARSVSHFIANSRFAQERIRQHYGRDSTVIHPPVDVEEFDPGRAREDFYLIVSELVPYKRVDIAVKAFARLQKRLVVIGGGSEFESLRRDAPANIQFLGRQPFDVLRRHYETCRAFLYPQIEDFGISALEAQAAGSPVIAYRQGGALETVIENKTGVFFDRQDADCLADVVLTFEKNSTLFSATECRSNAQRFSASIFREKIRAFLSAHVGIVV